MHLNLHQSESCLISYYCCVQSLYKCILKFNLARHIHCIYIDAKEKIDLFPSYKYYTIYKLWQMILNYLNLTFAVMFTVEMLLKWVAYGFVKYFSSVWTILDCFIVMVSLSSLFVKQDNLIALRSLRTLRALRPLRAISRWQGMKV